MYRFWISVIVSKGKLIRNLNKIAKIKSPHRSGGSPHGLVAQAATATRWNLTTLFAVVFSAYTKQSSVILLQHRRNLASP